MKKPSLKHKILFTTAIVGASFAAYSRRVYASCVNSGGSTYLCSGANASGQYINTNNASVSTAADFNVSTNAGNGITISGDGALSFNDTHTSTISTSYVGGGRTYLDNGNQYFHLGQGLLIYGAGNAGSTSGSVTINSNGDIYSRVTGIYTFNVGSGALSITAGGRISGLNQDGIYASNSSSGTNLTITTSGTIFGGRYGINARNCGSGALTITADGDVTGGNFGIYARNYGSGALSITANGTVTGGIYVVNYGTTLSVTTSAGTTVTGTSEYGILARNAGSGALTITADGAVTGGIYAHNSGTALSIITGVASMITGTNNGIYARNAGSGAISITVNGDVTSSGADGLLTRNGTPYHPTAYHYGTDLTVSQGAGSHITGATNGIEADSYGSGVTSVTVNGDVTGNGGDGIVVHNGRNYTYNSNSYILHYGSNLIVDQGTTTSYITGSTNGIEAHNYGSGYLSITANGAVTGTSEYGILAKNSAYGTSLTITTGTGSTITGANLGIFARNYGSGALSVTVDGNVSAIYGIVAVNSGGGGSSITIGADSTVTGSSVGAVAINLSGTYLNIMTGAGSTVTGDHYGIYARNQGTGALSISIGGDITSAGEEVVAFNSANSVDVNITTGAGSTVTGSVNGINGFTVYNPAPSYSHPISGHFGIFARGYGYGSLSITADGDVTGTTGDGIYLDSQEASYLSITTGSASTITGGRNGIYVFNDGVGGSGSTAIYVGGNVTGTGGDGVFAKSLYAMTITAAASSSITGSVDGIYANIFTGTGDLSITTGPGSTVTGGALGIYARNQGTGSLSINIGGDITNAHEEVVAFNGTSSGGLNIATGAGSHINGSYSGIYAETATYVLSYSHPTSGHFGVFAHSYSGGSLSIMADGTVTGGAYGIKAENYGNSYLSITTSAGSTITGGTDGIHARSQASQTYGALSITTDGHVTGTAHDGIFAYNSVGTSLTITTGAASVITGAHDGIYAWNEGGNIGDLSITANGTVTGTNGAGINAQNFYNNLYVTTGAGSMITGSTHGIFAFNRSSGVLTITALTITADGDVGGGIYARNYYAGNVSITVGGDVTGGIIAQGQFVTVSVAAGGTVAGGIYTNQGALNYSDGDINIDVGGTVTGGISGSSFGSLEITTDAGSNVSGATGIHANINGTTGYNLSITANGDVTGTGGDGIYAHIGPDWGTNLSITTGAGSTVTGATNGIYALNGGNGYLSVTANGNVTGAGGIDASNSDYGTDVSVTTGAGTTVTGTSGDGINANDQGTGALTVTAYGNVAGSHDGISAKSYGNYGLTVTTGTGTTVTGTSGDGIYAKNLVNGALTITANGNVSGGVDGIYAFNSESTNLSITTGPGTTVSGGTLGIYARNGGQGYLSINIGGNITTNGEDVVAFNSTNSGDINIGTGTGSTVTGSVDGISVVNNPNASPTYSHPTSGHYGIFARGYNNGNLTITTGTVTGGTNGIYANNQGTGSTSVTVGGVVTGSNGYGIIAKNSRSSGGIYINTLAGSTVSGTGFMGIGATNNSPSSPLTITAYGDVHNGISASNSGTALTITTGVDSYITGGINVGNDGYAGTYITINGHVTGGINVSNDPSGHQATSLSISTGSGSVVTGNSDGIDSQNETYSGGASATITVNGDVTGTNGDGINARENFYSNVSITTGVSSTVTGGYRGIDAHIVEGTGYSLNIGIYGNVTGTSNDGIYALNNTGTNLTITTGASSTITGGTNGIEANNFGNGYLSITANGDVTGTSGDGIYAKNSHYGTNLTITTGASSTITGSTNGIDARNYGSGTLSIMANGDVSGGIAASMLTTRGTGR